MAKTRQLHREEQVVRQAIIGEQHAFTTLYDAYVSSIYRFIFMRVEDQQTAEDITSAVFLKAWEKLHTYQQRGLPFRAWLFRIARNAVIDHYRTRKEVAPLEAAANSSDKSPSVAEGVANKMEAEGILDLMNKLTEDQRNVLTLKLVHGLNTEEVAQALGKRQGAVRALQMRGLQTLAKLLEQK